MKPTATIHWTIDGVKHSREYDYLPHLQAHIRSLQQDDIVFVVCVASPNFPLPSLASEDGGTGSENDGRNKTITAI